MEDWGGGGGWWDIWGRLNQGGGWGFGEEECKWMGLLCLEVCFSALERRACVSSRVDSSLACSKFYAQAFSTDA